MKRTALTICTLGLLTALACSTPSGSSSTELTFITHLDANLPEQDVFIKRDTSSDEVFRLTVGDNDLSAPLYRTAERVPHNPFAPEAIGPHQAGEPMGMTAGDWLRATGVARYTCTDGEGHLEASFEGLVPSGVYTMWHVFVSLPPTEPFAGALELPIGARDGSESIFHADASGNAQLDRTFKPCLQMSDVWTTSMLAVSWHSDGKTWGASPGAFGLNSHVPLFVKLPLRAGL
jgi:hypothetical protein